MTYDPKQTIVTFGAIIISGVGVNNGVDKINVTPSSDGIVKSGSGIDGRVQRTIDARNDFTMEIDIQQTSPLNDLLTAQFKLDKSTGTGYLPLTVKKLNGTTLHTAERAWITNLPADENTNEAGVRTWVFETSEKASMYVGGSLT